MQEIQNKPTLLKKQDVATRLNVTVRYVDKLRERGLLHAIKICGAVRFEPEAVERFVTEHLQAS